MTVLTNRLKPETGKYALKRDRLELSPKLKRKDWRTVKNDLGMFHLVELTR